MTTETTIEIHPGESGMMEAEFNAIAKMADPKVDQAVRFINEKTILSGVELANTVGNYILETFFEGDYARFSDPSRCKSVSFRSLLARDDLILGNATLYAFVRISHQLKSLPDDVASQLTLSHHRSLLPLRQPALKRDLARQALEEQWSSQKLSDEVRKLLPKSRSGRKPLPSFAKGVNKVAKVLETALEDTVTPHDVAKLGKEQSGVIIAQVEESLDRLQDLKEKLERILAGDT